MSEKGSIWHLLFLSLFKIGWSILLSKYVERLRFSFQMILNIIINYTDVR